MNYYYNVYGVTVESEMRIQELSVLNGGNGEEIDVKLSYKEMNNDIKDAVSMGTNASYKSKDMWFHIKGAATFHIFNGDTVHIEPCEDADYNIIKVYILGSVLGMVLLQRNIVAIHGGGIVIDGKGCVFTGDKGAGKSTITTALRQRGYKFVADDVCSIKDGTVKKINPGFGYQKLCEDTMVKLGYDVSKFDPFRSDTNIKYIVPALDNFIDHAVDFEAVFELCVGDVDTVEIKEILGMNKIQRLIKNVFRIEVLHYSGGVGSEYFSKCVDIAKGIKYYRIVRPRDGFTVDEQMGIIEDMLYKKEEICC